MRGGDNGSMQVASLIDTNGKENIVVTDIKTQCPGDHFELIFPSGRPGWTTFDRFTGKASAEAPKKLAVFELEGKVLMMTNDNVVDR